MAASGLMVRWPPGSGRGVPDWHDGLACDMESGGSWHEARVVGVKKDKVQMKIGSRRAEWLAKSSARLAALHSRSGKDDEDAALARKLQQELNTAPKRRGPAAAAAARPRAEPAPKKAKRKAKSTGPAVAYNGAGGVWAVGEELMALDKDSWYRAKVIAERAHPSDKTIKQQYRIHFMGWKARFDKWATPGAEADELRPVDDDEAVRAALEAAGDYEVESVVGKRLGENGRPEYRIQWRGYGEEEQTWEPLSNLRNAEEEVAKYEARTASVDLHEQEQEQEQAVEASGSTRSSSRNAATAASSTKRDGGNQQTAWGELWQTLVAQGWKEESGKRIGTDFFYLPPGISRSAPGMRCRRDFYDSKLQVRQYVEREQQKLKEAQEAAEEAAEEADVAMEEDDSLTAAAAAAAPKTKAPKTKPAASASAASSSSSSSSGSSGSSSGSGQKNLSDSWKELVVDCARKLNRSEKNIHAYVTPGELQPFCHVPLALRSLTHSLFATCHSLTQPFRHASLSLTYHMPRATRRLFATWLTSPQGSCSCSLRHSAKPPRGRCCARSAAAAAATRRRQGRGNCCHLRAPLLASA